ncbi:MAG TPA: universal stress protein [Gaiellaceae bacterium]|nr:universal stress protein [Gaiellaceae bacterium]
MKTTLYPQQLEAGRRNFTRILVGIDGSQQSLEAARQAALLQDPDGQLTLLAAWEITPLIAADGSYIPCYVDVTVQREVADSSLAAARDYVAPYTPATGKLVRGAATSQLLGEIERDQDTLVAIGSSGTGRLVGIVEGSVATAVIHRSPCSVLVSRPVKSGFPGRIAVGVDGSVESAAAYAAARHLAERFDAELHALVAWGGKGVNERLVATITDGEHDDVDEPPAEALTRAAESADLVVVGSRGLHGLSALGSVSERVAHTATCSALVVRETVWQRIAAELGR